MINRDLEISTMFIWDGWPVYLGTVIKAGTIKKVDKGYLLSDWIIRYPRFKKALSVSDVYAIVHKNKGLRSLKKII